MSKKVISIILLPFLLLVQVFPYATLAVETEMFVDPLRVTGLDVGETFEINVSVSDVTDLVGWQFVLYYRSEIVNAILTYDPEKGNYTEVLEGPFLKAAGATFFLVPVFTNNYNETHGRIVAACFAYGPTAVPQSGSGTLATITFEAKAIGNSPLALITDPPEIDAGLVSPSGPIPHATTDGSAHVGLYDIAITKLLLPRTVTNDTNLNIGVTVENQGEVAVTSDVTLQMSGYTPQTKRVTDIPGGASIILNYTVDTTPIPRGTYILTANAALSGDVDPEDNTYPPAGTIVSITETIEGDINGDFTVDIYDIVSVAVAFGSKPGNPNWNPNADVIIDNEIDIYDVVTIAGNFGRSAT